jgi:predicted secreted hydrolase
VRAGALIALLTLLLACAWLVRASSLPAAPTQQIASLNIQEVLGKTEGDNQFTPVIKPYSFEFPRDHAAHPGFHSEWWYTTGNLSDAQGRQYGFELTFFRQALTSEKPGKRGSAPEGRASAWAPSQGYMAHLAVTDVTGKRFLCTERLSRANLGMAGCTPAPHMKVWVEDWYFQLEHPASPEEIALKALQNGFGVDLKMRSLKAPVLQGDHGRSRKGPDETESSYYYSLTRLQTSGQIWLDGQPRQVTGLSWVDREWSSQSLDKDLKGWDWFALQLNDGTEVMAYFLRKTDGSYSSFSGASLSDAKGATHWLSASELSLDVTGHWTSPIDGTTYPAGWTLHLKGQHRIYRIRPLLAQQELNVSARYWEGAVAVSSSSDEPGASSVSEKEVAGAQGTGYVELVGYAR